MDKTFRYLEKFVGKYRVKAHYCIDTNDFPRNDNGGIDESFEDLYIPCKKGEIRATCRVGILAWLLENKLATGRSVNKRLQEKYPDLEYDYEEIGEDVLITFRESDLKKFDSILHLQTSGKGVKPFSIANLPKGDYTMPEEDLNQFTSIYSDLEKYDKMHFSRQVLKEFDEVILKKKSQKALDDRKQSGLNNKEYIHYLGLWDDFIKYAKKQYKEYIKK